MEQKKDSKQVTMTKNLIKTVFIELLKENEVKDIKVTEICKMAEVNRSTFYAYYKDPFDLLVGIKEDIMEDTREIVNRYSMYPIEKKTFYALRDHLGYLEKQLDFIDAISPYSSRSLENPLNIMEIVCGEYIEKAAEKIMLDASGKRTFKTFAVFGATGVIRRWTKEPNHIPPSELASHVLTMIDNFAEGSKNYGIYKKLY